MKMQRNSTKEVENTQVLKGKKVQRFGCKGSTQSATAFDFLETEICMARLAHSCI